MLPGMLPEWSLGRRLRQRRRHASPHGRPGTECCLLWSVTIQGLRSYGEIVLETVGPLESPASFHFYSHLYSVRAYLLGAPAETGSPSVAYMEANQ